MIEENEEFENQLNEGKFSDYHQMQTSDTFERNESATQPST
jgi:hypothetical protein